MLSLQHPLPPSYAPRFAMVRSIINHKLDRVNNDAIPSRFGGTIYDITEGCQVSDLRPNGVVYSVTTKYASVVCIVVLGIDTEILAVLMSFSATLFACREFINAVIALAASSRASATVSFSTDTPTSSVATSGSPVTEPLPVTWIVRSTAEDDNTSEAIFTSQAVKDRISNVPIAKNR